MASYHGPSMTGPDPSDDALLREFARTRGEAPFEQLVERHWSRTYRLAHDCLHDAATAEERSSSAACQRCPWSSGS